MDKKSSHHILVSIISVLVLTAASTARGNDAKRRTTIPNGQADIIIDYNPGNQSNDLYIVTPALPDKSQWLEEIGKARSQGYSDHLQPLDRSFSASSGTHLGIYVVDINGSLATCTVKGTPIPVDTSGLSLIKSLITALEGGKVPTIGSLLSAGNSGETLKTALKGIDGEIGQANGLARDALDVLKRYQGSATFPPLFDEKVGLKPWPSDLVPSLEANIRIVDTELAKIQGPNGADSGLRDAVTAFFDKNLATTHDQVVALQKSYTDAATSLAAYDSVHAGATFAKSYILSGEYATTAGGDTVDITIEPTKGAAAGAVPSSSLTKKVVSLTIGVSDATPRFIAYLMPAGVAQYQNYNFVKGPSSTQSQTLIDSPYMASAGAALGFYPFSKGWDKFGFTFGFGAAYERLQKLSPNNITTFVGLTYSMRDYSFMAGLADTRNPVLTGTALDSSGNFVTHFNHHQSFFVGFGINLTAFSKLGGSKPKSTGGSGSAPSSGG